MALNSTVPPSCNCLLKESMCLSNTSSVTCPPPASSAQYPALAAAATISGSTVVGVMPARSTGALPVSLLNFVTTFFPAGVSITRGAKSAQQPVRNNSASATLVVLAFARAFIVPTSTTPAPLPCSSTFVNLPSTSPGPMSSTYNSRAFTLFKTFAICFAQSTGSTSTAFASFSASSASNPASFAQASTCSTAGFMIGEWNGTVTSKYSAIGAKTDPPRSFISRIFLERCDSFCA